jgi:hypothetical protein
VSGLEGGFENYEIYELVYWFDVFDCYRVCLCYNTPFSSCAAFAGTGAGRRGPGQDSSTGYIRHHLREGRIKGVRAFKEILPGSSN